MGAGIDPTSFNKLADELDADAFREPRTRVFEQPMTPGEAAGHVRAWLAQPVVQVLEPRADHSERVATTREFALARARQALLVGAPQYSNRGVGDHAQVA